METTENKKEVLKVPSASEKIALMIADSLELHQQAMRLLYLGASNFEIQETMGDNERYTIKVRSMCKVIWCQKELIRNASALVYQKTGEDSEDYKDLKIISDFLDYNENEIITAELTKTKADDFQARTIDYEGNEKVVLTKNFYEMRAKLEESFQEIYKIMLRNGLLAEFIQQQPRKVKAGGIF